MASKSTLDYPIVELDSPSRWRNWLELNHAKVAGVWLKLYKKTSGKVTLTHTQALDEALCFGWIDGLGKKLDDQAWLLKFTPRRPKSVWSKRNKEHITRLTKAGKMHESGLNEVKKAKNDGRWEQAYDSPSTMQMPQDFLDALKTDPIAETFFKTLNKTNLYAIGWRLQTARKPETREKRKKAIIEMLHQNKKFH